MRVRDLCGDYSGPFMLDQCHIGLFTLLLLLSLLFLSLINGEPRPTGPPKPHFQMAQMRVFWRMKGSLRTRRGTLAQLFVIIMSV